MKKSLRAFCAVALSSMLLYISCSKNSSVPSNVPFTIENLSGTYQLAALSWNYGGLNVNIYDSLDNCEKDNLTQLNTDKSFKLIDAGTVCTPPEDGDGTWDIKQDSLLFDTDYGHTKIESFDGTTLVLSGHPEGYEDVTATVTFKKKL